MKTLFYGAQIAKMFCGDLFKLMDENGVAYDMVEPGSLEDLTAATKDHEAIVTFFPLDAEKINALSDSIKGIVVTSIGYDNIDVEAANKRGIMVCNIPDYCVEEVALHSVTLLLASLRNICLYDRTIRAGKWTTRSMVCGPSPPPSVYHDHGLYRLGRSARPWPSRCPAGRAHDRYDPICP